MKNYNSIQASEKNYTVIIDGKTMSYYEMLCEKEKVTFLSLMSLSSSAICCRLTPKQKAKIVGLIKINLNKITLAVGDGTNDVPMIMEANIGIGISGKEGTQVRKIHL